MNNKAKENVITKFYQIDWDSEIVEKLPEKEKQPYLLSYHHMLFQGIKNHFMDVRGKLDPTNTYAKAKIVRILEYFWAKTCYHHYHFYKKKQENYFPVKIRRHGYRKSDVTLTELKLMETIFAKALNLEKPE